MFRALWRGFDDWSRYWQKSSFWKKHHTQFNTGVKKTCWLASLTLWGCTYLCSPYKEVSTPPHPTPLPVVNLTGCTLTFVDNHLRFKNQIYWKDTVQTGKATLLLICGLLHGDAGVVVVLSDHSLEDLHFLFVSILPSHGRRFLRLNSFQYNNGEFLCFSLSKDCNFLVVALISSIPIQLRVFLTFLQFFFFALKRWNAWVCSAVS